MTVDFPAIDGKLYNFVCSSAHGISSKDRDHWPPSETSPEACLSLLFLRGSRRFYASEQLVELTSKNIHVYSLLAPPTTWCQRWWKLLCFCTNAELIWMIL